jgi:23S rRNA (guanosine2251-2'-O)-methyltransferase
MSTQAPSSGKSSLPENLFTLFGRQTVLEAISDTSILPYKLHLAESNKTGGTLADILKIAEKRQIPLAWHSRLELSRISRNGKQDQGVALDIRIPTLQKTDTLLHTIRQKKMRLLALDQITNPQNVGMIMRSVAAGNMDGLIIPKRGCARLDALVIKASAGTFFRTPVFICDDLTELLQQLQQQKVNIALMAADAKQSLFSHYADQSIIYVLGNETDGVSASIRKLPHTPLAIPMANGVESLNVAMTATLIAYLQQ